MYTYNNNNNNNNKRVIYYQTRNTLFTQSASELVAV